MWAEMCMAGMHCQTREELQQLRESEPAKESDLEEIQGT
jgi:hypothetical protein